jgi:hypothetical protein
MRPFECPNCRRLNHFEVRVCPGCNATLGYDPAIDGFRFLADDATVWRDDRGGAGEVVVCQNNNAFQICNWLIGSGDSTRFCRACRHNRTIPDLTVLSVPPRWAKVEAAKRRLFHELIRLGAPLETKTQEVPGRQGLAFDFLYDPAGENLGHAQILTGHDSGVITLNLIEADDAERERARQRLGEPYRTLLGHFRHEAGHHFWSRLVRDDSEMLAECRCLFGDDRQDYDAAIEAHYAAAGGKVWTEDFVSYYATSHPWEDFAETFAHHLHIVDLLATARGFDLSIEPLPDTPADGGEIAVDFDPYTAPTAQLAARMAPLSFAMNSINRSMGQNDLYPFHLSEAIITKLDFVNRLLAKARAAPPMELAPAG